MLLLGEENSYLKGTKHTLPKKIVDLYHNIILKYPQFSANGGFRKANHVLENGGVVTMEWLKGMKSFFNKHKDTNDIDFVLGGGILVKTFIENKLDQLTASTPKTRKQHTNSPVKPLKPADNLSGNRGEKSSEALSMVKSLMTNIIPKIENKQKLVGDKRIRITESQLKEIKEYLLNEKSISGKKDVKTTIKNLKKLPNELKDFASQHLDNITHAGDGRVSGLNLPSDFSAKLKNENLPNGFSMGVDKDGYYIHTHRARSKSHEDYMKITQKEIKFIDSTG